MERNQSVSSCFPVIDGDRSCIVPVSSQPQHLVPSPGGEAACGVRPQPWILEAQPGQRINISLIGFSVARNAPDDRLSGDHRNDNICEAEFRHGYVLDKIAKKNISLCSSVFDFEKRDTSASVRWECGRSCADEANGNGSSHGKQQNCRQV